MSEIIPRPKAKAPSWTKMLLVFSLIVLGFSIFGYFGVRWGQRSTQEKIDQVKKDIIALASPQNKALEAKIMTAQYQMGEFSGLLNSHQYASKFFDLVRVVIHPDVLLTNFKLSVEKNQAELKGRVKNFQALGEQVLAFRQQEKIKSAVLSQLFLDKEGRINFVLDLGLAPGLFK